MSIHMIHLPAPPSSGPTPENLTRRQELFRLIRDSHIKWMHVSKDQNMKERHRSLAELFDIIIQQYSVLLDRLPLTDGTQS